tara:strand:- start:51 stop:209 length:159 start_codon:yes stop_codon:yes gene_type:complete
MRTFKYQVTWHSFFKSPDVFIVDTDEEVELLKREGKAQQYKVTVEEGNFTFS